MNKSKLQKFMKEVDKTKMPKHWKKFINQNVKKHNIILKFGNRAFCTHCQKYLDEKVEVHPYKKAKCKWCGKEYYVSNCNIRNYSFLKDIAFYTKVENQIVLRIFEIKSTYNPETKTFKQDLQEFARFIPGFGVVINNAVSFYMWHQKVWHNSKIISWHVYTGKKLLYEMPIYPYNKSQVFKNTPIEYAPIKEFRKAYPYYDKFQILQIANYQSFELLWKMGLYCLSLSSKHFNKKGSFVQRFGVPKTFLKFMVDNNLNYEEYRILKLLQEPNINLIKQYSHYDYNYLSFMNKQGFLKRPDILSKFRYDISALRTICKYTSLRKFLTYEKGVKNIQLYADYLNMANTLNYSIKSKKRLFPKQLKARHDELSKKIKVAEDMNTQFAVYLQYLKLSKYTFSDNKYIIFPAPSVDYIKDEGKQQNNCVATTYLIPYSQGKTEIYFIRKLENPTVSFITLEYACNRVVQKELPSHKNNFSQEQLDFIDKWLKFREFMNCKEKYQNNKKTEKIHYDFEKSVA